MAGPGYDFEVRPQLLAAYAQALDVAARDLSAVREVLASGRTHAERKWFGKLPQSGLLADRYAAHREAGIAGAAGLGAWLAAAADGLRVSARRYSAADRVVAEAAGTVEAALGVGIETGAGSAASTSSIAPTASIAEPDEAAG